MLAAAAFEIETRGEFLARLVDGVVDFLRVHFRNDIEGGHRGSGEGRARGGFVGKNSKDLIEAGDLENVAHALAEPEQTELSAIARKPLQRFDENRET
jgi:hypothetical protein